MDVIAHMLPGKDRGGKMQFMSGRRVAAADTGIYVWSCPNHGKPVFGPLSGAGWPCHD